MVAKLKLKSAPFCGYMAQKVAYNIIAVHYCHRAQQKLNYWAFFSVLDNMYEKKWKILFFFLSFPLIVYFVFKCIVFLTHRVSLLFNEDNDPYLWE